MSGVSGVRGIARIAHRLTGTGDARRRTKAALRQAEERFRGAFETAAIGMALVSPDGRLLQVNPSLCAFLGYEADELLSRSFQDITHPDDLDADLHEVRALLAGEIVTYKLEKRYLHAEGRTVWALLSVSLVHDETGEPLHFVSQIEDITDRKRTEAALREAEQRFRRAFEDSATGMALVAIDGDNAGRFLEVNQALCEIAGHSPPELCAMRFWDFVHPDDVERIGPNVLALARGDIATHQAEVRFMGKGENRRWAAFNASLVRDAEGEPVHAVVHIQDITERKRFEGQLKHLADHDALTALFNRRRFAAELEREVLAANRYGSGGAVLVLDLDHFKLVNDAHGHAQGDKLIAEIAKALRKRLRATDTIGRLGGDEFGVILPWAGREQALNVAEELGEVVRAARVGSGLEGRRMTASIGVALFEDRRDTGGGEELLVEADIAMYDAKEAGRDQVRAYDPGEDRQMREHARLTWVDRIRDALDEGRFTLHAQPIEPLQAEDEERYELLIRMIDRGGELVPPGSFLPVAERADLIHELDAWVVREAAGLLGRDREAGRSVVYEINVSSKSISKPHFLELVARELANAGADPSKLVFEMTETEAVVNVEQAAAFADGVRALGCEFALDDFGAGFASFYYIKHLSFDYLKIDGEFIEDLASSHTNQLVVQAVVEVASGLGKRTVAEFVTDKASLELLRAYGVDFAQGFHIGKPGPLEMVVHPQADSHESSADRAPAIRSRRPAPAAHRSASQVAPQAPQGLRAPA